jgi:hypothetical protein
MSREKIQLRYWFFADTPNIARNCQALFAKIYEPIFTVVSNIGEDVRTIPLFQLSA